MVDKLHKPEQKKVVKRTVQDDQGRTRTVYIDLKTYKEVPDEVVAKGGYIIVNPHNQFIEPVTDVTNPNEPSKLRTFEELNRKLIEGDTIGGPERPPSMIGDISNKDYNAVAKDVARIGNQPDLNAIEDAKNVGGSVGAKYNSIGAPVGGGVDSSSPVATGSGQASTPSINNQDSEAVARSPQDRPDNYSYGGPKGNFDTFDMAHTKSPNRPGENLTQAEGPQGSFDVHGAEKGKGLAALSDPSGSGRNQPAGAQIKDITAQAIANVLGPDWAGDVTSGTYTPEKQAAIDSQLGIGSMSGAHKAGMVGSTRHNHGKALDTGAINTKTGEYATPDQMRDVAQEAAALGASGVGIGPGYMDQDGISRTHLDVANPDNPASWGDKNTYATQDPETRRSVLGGMGLSMNPDMTTGEKLGQHMTPMHYQENAIPQARPGTETVSPNTPAPNYAGPNNVTQGNYSPSVASGIVNQAKTPGFDPVIGEDISNASPAKMSALGIGAKYTPADMAEIGRTIAGEMYHTLPDLSSLDPAKREQAMKEAANMTTSIANRAQSQKYSSLAETLDPGQYNSLMPDNLATTNANFEKYQNDIMGVVQGTLDGTIQPSNSDITSYHSNNVNPGWSKTMAAAAPAGEHIFGNLPEYGPNKSFQADRARMSMSQEANPGSFTGHPDYAGRQTPGYDGHGYSSNRDSPTEGGPGRFGGHGLGSNAGSSSNGNSPSEGGGRFGGSGLGSPSSKSDKDSSKSVGPSGGGYGWGGPH